MSVSTSDFNQPLGCKVCGHIACVCNITTNHLDSCPFRRAATCAVGIECEHGRDVCPTCDACNCPEKALSIRQPWAWAILHAGKDVENRSWQAVNHGLTVRGRIAIHASRGLGRAEYVGVAAWMDEIGVKCPPAADLARGGIIGSVEVVDVVKDHFSQWFFGPRGLILRDPQPCEFIPVKGALGYFDWRKFRTDEVPEPAKWMLPNAPKSETTGTLI